MNRFRNVKWMAAGAALALVPTLMSAQMGGQADAKPARIAGKTLMAADELKWAPMPGLEGAQQAMLWGDPTKEAHRIFYKWPAGTKAPLHSHTNGDRGVVVSGTLSWRSRARLRRSSRPGPTSRSAAA
jgi:hypothetical protein